MKAFPGTLLGRTAFVIAAVLIITLAVALALFRAYNRGPLFQEMAGLVTGQLRVISAALEALPEEQRIDFLDILEETQGIRVIPDTAGTLPSSKPQSPQLQNFADFLRRELGDGTEFFVQKSGGQALWVLLTINKEKYWISIPRQQIERPPPWLWFGWMGFSALLVLLGAFLLVRRVNRPLRELTVAARQLGAGKTPPLLAELGPTEVREVSRAFNQMAEDIRSHDAERALLLAGVSHDLRTPLSRLRVSLDIAGNVDAELHSGMVQDIEEIDAIIHQFLDFARVASDEPAELTDLNELVESTVKRYVSLGNDVKAKTTPLPSLRLRRLAMQRLLDNLTTNALRHAGGEVVVCTELEQGRATLSVLDRGPGIAASEVERLKQPFTRMESARSNAGHAGLGLAIVDRVAALHQATFELLPRPGGGLQAKILFSH